MSTFRPQTELPPLPDLNLAYRESLADQCQQEAQAILEEHQETGQDIMELLVELINFRLETDL